MGSLSDVDRSSIESRDRRFVGRIVDVAIDPASRSRLVFGGSETQMCGASTAADFPSVSTVVN